MEPHTHLSAEEKKALFTSVTITHRQLEAVHDRIRRAIRQPAGFSFVLVHGPTGVGKTRMMESLAEQARDLLLPQSALASSFPLTPYRLSPPPMPVLMIEAKFPDKNAFNRGQFYRTILKLLGEQTYPQQMQVDIHAESAASHAPPPSPTMILSCEKRLMLRCISMEYACFLSMRPITCCMEKREREGARFRNNWSG